MRATKCRRIAPAYPIAIPPPIASRAICLPWWRILTPAHPWRMEKAKAGKSRPSNFAMAKFRASYLGIHHAALRRFCEIPIGHTPHRTAEDGARLDIKKRHLIYNLRFTVIIPRAGRRAPVALARTPHGIPPAPRATHVYESENEWPRGREITAGNYPLVRNAEQYLRGPSYFRSQKGLGIDSQSRIFGETWRVSNVPGEGRKMRQSALKKLPNVECDS